MNYHKDHDRKALDAIAKDMGLHDGANRDAALGLPLEEHERFDEMTGGFDDNAVLEHAKHAGMRRDPYSPNNGTTPGQQPSRTDAASLSETQARRDACRAVERWAYRALLASGLTPFQLTLLKGYHDSVYHTRIADLNVAHAREDMKKGGAK